MVPKDILVYSAMSKNIELMKLFLGKEGIEINANDDVYFNNFIFQNNIWNFFKLFETALMIASEKGHTEIVKILVE